MVFGRFARVPGKVVKYGSAGAEYVLRVNKAEKTVTKHKVKDVSKGESKAVEKVEKPGGKAAVEEVHDQAAVSKGTDNSIQYVETGARNISPEQFFKEEAIAEEMYEKFRNLGTEDVNAIAKNTGFSVARIQRIKDHVFNNSHVRP